MAGDQHVAYRAARAGIITGVLLAIARITGETAPLLFTALNNQFFSWNLKNSLSRRKQKRRRRRSPTGAPVVLQAARAAQ